MSEHHHACVTPASPTFAPKRLGGGEAAVIVTVLILAGSLALTGMPVDQIVQILSWAGLIAVALITAAGTRPLRGLTRAVRALLDPSSQR
ncbi:hypothetical protein JCM4814A_78910 [Streptomyces phaeofaciens JCM 4814]|uniref:Uncharacterized protein n=1 Tax=Streptomyces phaeofaciens TaxID=68254 RepID=A0A918HSD1_9ACTN|nr:hypothetical protein GCM10010226_87280 [Streptomyces phaeofaciens]